jgi:hypothetical protein
MLYARWVKNSLLALGTPTLKVRAAGHKAITLDWTKVKGAEGYEVWKKIGSSYKYYKTVDEGSSYTDENLTAGTYYYYKVRAYHTPYLDKVYSGFSYYKYTKPVWPALTLSVSPLTYKSIGLSWNTVTGADKYDVYRGTSYTKINEKLATDITETEYEDNSTGLTLGKTYYYRVVPKDSASAQENKYTAYKYIKLGWPTLTLKATILTYKSIGLSWNPVAGADKYDVYRGTSSTNIKERIATDLTVTEHKDS